MNQKGEITIATMLFISLLSSIFVVITVEVTKNCRFYCKLDLPKYQEISGVSRYGDSDKIVSTGLSGPIFYRERRENGILTENRFVVGYR